VFWHRTIALAAVALAGVRRLLVIVKVEGVSMTPTLAPGDRVLVCRLPARLWRCGQIVAIRFAGYPPDQWVGLTPPERHPDWVIKRIAARHGQLAPALRSGERNVVPQGYVFVLGDGTISLDSRDWGALPVSDVLGVMVLRLPRATPSRVH